MPVNLQAQIQSQLKQIKERELAQEREERAYERERAQYIDNLTRILIEAGVEEETIEVKSCNPRGFAHLTFVVSGVKLEIHQPNVHSINLKCGSPLRFGRTLTALPSVELLSSAIADCVAEEIYKSLPIPLNN